MDTRFKSYLKLIWAACRRKSSGPVLTLNYPDATQTPP